MLVKNLNVKNSSVDFKNINLDFSDNGFYLIKGPSGTGKTTILDNIIFSKNCCFFSNEQDANLFYNDKYKLITYITQNIFPSNDTIDSFLTKHNEHLNKEKINEYLDIFGLEYLKENSNQTLFKSLSGGEKQLLHIISGLAKETSYIIIDEPTNNLDTDKIDILLNVLNTLKTTHKIIVVSHCEVFDKIKDFEVVVTKNYIKHTTIINNNENNFSNTIKKQNHKIKKSFIFKTVLNKIFILTILLFVFLSVLATSF